MIKSLFLNREFLRQGIRAIHQKISAQSIDKPTSLTNQYAGNIQLIENESLEEALENLNNEKSQSVLEECKEDISHIAPYLRPTFNLAAYVNKSETLKELLKLGVNLYKIEKQKDAPGFIASLDFEKDVKEHVVFLYDLGLSIEDIGNFITENPFVFKEDLDNLKTRILYLKYKKFDDKAITRIISSNSDWLKFSTQEIDDKLGFFQNKFKLSGNEVRELAIKQPKLITYSKNMIKKNLFTLKEEMGFDDRELKSILKQKPRIFMKGHQNIIKTFEYLHNVMQISHEDIVKCPEILTCREHKLRERYIFLQKLNRVQFDPKKPNYVSLISLVSHSDAHFAVEIAKSSIQVYNEFLKTL